MAEARVVALGPAEEVLPYLAMGALVREAAGAEDTARALAELAREPSAALVLMPESAAQAAPEAVAEFRARAAGALLVLPGSRGGRGLALAEMKAFLERAVGVDLIGKLS